MGDLVPYAAGRAAVWHGDCLDILAALPDASVDSIVTDPPYGLGFMGKQWDSGKSFVERKAAKHNTFDHVGGNHNPANSKDQQRTRLRENTAYGEFMQDWARECLRVLKPGGHLVAFGGTRTFHRLACAIEDAGFEIRDSIAWLYGSGFPKSKTVLKPSFEPVVLARKALDGTEKANVLTHGTGALNVDGCRVAHASAADLAESVSKNRHADFGSGPRDNQVFGADNRARGESGNYDGSQGRWPANVVLDEAQAAVLDGQSGTTKGRKTKPRAAAEPGEGWRMTATGTEHDDIGGASRFFYCAKAPAKERPAYLRFDCYCEGPAVVTVPGVRRDGETCPECGAGTRKAAHPTVKPLTFMRWLARLVTPPGGLVVDTFAGTGTTGEACLLEGFRVLLVEQDGEHIPLIAHRLSSYETPEEASA